MNKDRSNISVSDTNLDLKKIKIRCCDCDSLLNLNWINQHEIIFICDKKQVNNIN